VIAALRAGRAAVGTVLVVLAGANLTSELLKRVLAEPRFSAVPGGRLPSATAWPSGHATAAASLVLACVIVSPVRWRPRVAAVGTAFFLTIAYALMTLRWHYETDVIGGLAVATGWGLLATGLLGRRLPARPGRDAVRGVVAAAAVTWVLLVAVAWPYLLHYAESRSAFLAGTGVLAGCTAVAVGALARVGGRPVLGRDLANTAGRVRAPSRRTQPAEAEQLPS
jgi:membrane-associated phospholipid phosphatase